MDEHLGANRKVAGSSPAEDAISTRDNVQLGRTLAPEAGGWGFDSLCPDHPSRDSGAHLVSDEHPFRQSVNTHFAPVNARFASREQWGLHGPSQLSAPRAGAVKAEETEGFRRQPSLDGAEHGGTRRSGRAIWVFTAADPGVHAELIPGVQAQPILAFKFGRYAQDSGPHHRKDTHANSRSRSRPPTATYRAVAARDRYAVRGQGRGRRGPMPPTVRTSSTSVAARTRCSRSCRRSTSVRAPATGSTSSSRSMSHRSRPDIPPVRQTREGFIVAPSSSTPRVPIPWEGAQRLSNTRRRRRASDGPLEPWSSKRPESLQRPGPGLAREAKPAA